MVKIINLFREKQHSHGQNNQAPSEKSITPMVKIIKLLPRVASALYDQNYSHYF